jgi:serine/threonine protein kinase
MSSSRAKEERGEYKRGRWIGADELRTSTFTAQNKLLHTHFQKHGRIGEGAYGVVYKAESTNDKNHKVVAIKQMKNTREGLGIPQDAYREIKVTSPFVSFLCDLPLISPLPASDSQGASTRKHYSLGSCLLEPTRK